MTNRTPSPIKYRFQAGLLLSALLLVLVRSGNDNENDPSAMKQAREEAKPYFLVNGELIVYAITAICGLVLYLGWQSSAVYARASHILTKTKEECEAAKKTIGNDTQKFAGVAKETSMCPSGKADGGSLGKFSQGSMVPPFEKVVFDQDKNIGVVYGPIETEFGFHLILITERKGV